MYVSVHESRKDKVLSTVDLIMSVLIRKLRANEQNPTIITDHITNIKKKSVTVQVCIWGMDISMLMDCISMVR